MDIERIPLPRSAGMGKNDNLDYKIPVTHLKGQKGNGDMQASEQY